MSSDDLLQEVIMQNGNKRRRKHPAPRQQQDHRQQSSTDQQRHSRNREKKRTHGDGGGIIGGAGASSSPSSTRILNKMNQSKKKKKKRRRVMDHQSPVSSSKSGAGQQYNGELPLPSRKPIDVGLPACSQELSSEMEAPQDVAKPGFFARTVSTLVGSEVHIPANYQLRLSGCVLRHDVRAPALASLAVGTRGPGKQAHLKTVQGDHLEGGHLLCHLCWQPQPFPSGMPQASLDVCFVGPNTISLRAQNTSTPDVAMDVHGFMAEIGSASDPLFEKSSSFAVQLDSSSAAGGSATAASASMSNSVPRPIMDELAAHNFEDLSD